MTEVDWVLNGVYAVYVVAPLLKNELMLILDGEASVMSEDHREIARLGAMDIVGEMSFVTGEALRPRSFRWARCACPVGVVPNWTCWARALHSSRNEDDEGVAIAVAEYRRLRKISSRFP
ncbi:MAG: hypothetical protein ACLFRT_08170 [Actinomycetota bacterium]